jgi:ArsR family transcriptional regulator
MGISKAFAFSEQENRVASLAKALAHPARIAILRLLLQKKSCICGAIVDELPLSQSTISQHLKELKAAGLIKGTIDGVSICYCINEDTWTNARVLLNNFFQEVDGGVDCC